MKYILGIALFILSGCHFSVGMPVDRVQAAYDFGKTQGYKMAVADMESGKIMLQNGKVYRKD